MSHIVNSETPGKRRTSILKLLANLQPEIDSQNISQEIRNDVIAFVILSLTELEKTIHETIVPWEKRGYWTKAEQFTAEWNWVSSIKSRMLNTETSKGWTDWPEEIIRLKEHLINIKPTRKKMGSFWMGSYKRYKHQAIKK